MAVNRILKQELKMKRECSVWVPHLLTREQVELCLWLVEENLKKFQDLDYRY